MKQAVRVAITGAAGNIGYAMAFRIAVGDMLGPDQPVILHLIEIAPAMDALNGVVMELNDCAFPLLAGVVATSDLDQGFKDVNYGLLVGARPRGPGMERKDLLSANGAIFGPQGKAINDHAARDVRVLVVGNPANTNALIAAANAPDLNPTQFTAMMRLDHNRALSQLAEKLGVHHTDLSRMIVWGNHSATQYPDISQCEVAGQPAKDKVDQAWYVDTFIPTVQQRGAAIIKARGAHPRHRPRPQRLITCAPGPWVRRRGTGSPWACPPMAATALSPGSCMAFPVPVVTASIRSSRAWRWTISAVAAWLRPRPNFERSAPLWRTC